MSDMANNGYELDWGAEIEKESAFVLAPAGDYNFTIVGFSRERHPGADWLPACNKAVLSVRIVTQAGEECIIKHNLFLHSKREWQLCEFFTAIGQRQSGQRVAMNWNAVNGATGRCKVKVRKYTKNGTEYETNDIDKFYAPDGNLLPKAPNQVPQQPVQQTFGGVGAGVGYTAGKF